MSHRQPAPPLADERARRGITLEQIRDCTKIGMFFLRAIEDGEYHKLPGGIYSTSYIRQYAQAAGVDESAILQQYRQAVQADA